MIRRLNKAAAVKESEVRLKFIKLHKIDSKRTQQIVVYIESHYIFTS